MKTRYVVAIHIDPPIINHPRIEAITYTQESDDQPWIGSNGTFLCSGDMRDIQIPMIHQYVFCDPSMAGAFKAGIEASMKALVDFTKTMLSGS